MAFALEKVQIFIAKLICIHKKLEMKGVFICFYVVLKI